MSFAEDLKVLIDSFTKGTQVAGGKITGVKKNHAKRFREE